MKGILLASFDSYRDIELIRIYMKSIKKPAICLRVSVKLHLLRDRPAYLQHGGMHSPLYLMAHFDARADRPNGSLTSVRKSGKSILVWP